MDEWATRNYINNYKDALKKLKEEFGCEIHFGELDDKGCKNMIKWFEEN